MNGVGGDGGAHFKRSVGAPPSAKNDPAMDVTWCTRCHPARAGFGHHRHRGGALPRPMAIAHTWFDPRPVAGWG